MKVECCVIKIDNKVYGALTLKKHYLVLTIEIYDKESSIFAQSIGSHIVYRIENDDGTVVPYPSNLFQITSGKIPAGWKAIHESGCFRITPDIWFFDDFWEKYYNGDSNVMGLYIDGKQKIILEELSIDEINNIIREGDSLSLQTILSALIKYNDERFLNVMLEYSKACLQNDNYYYSSNEVSHLLVLSFNYLSMFKITEIENFFIEYLTDSIQKEELTRVVNDFFKSEG